MIASQELLRRCHDAAVMGVDNPDEPESLIGFFQNFRPDGNGLTGLFDDLPGGADLHSRLDAMFDSAGNDRRPDGRRDAYFVVWSPPTIEASEVGRLAEGWLTGVASLAAVLGDEALASGLSPAPKIRVLEGKPPKNPKHEIDQSPLLKLFLDRVPRLLDTLAPPDSLAAVLRPAYYFIGCDAVLRDYLMWPLFAEALAARSLADPDPLADYFKLWQHGIKYRIVRQDTIDFYIPRPPIRIPVEAISGGI